MCAGLNGSRRKLIENGVIQRKFALLDKYLLELQKRLKDVTFEQFQQDWGLLQRLTERSLQVMIEVVIDVTERLLALKEAGPAASATEAIEKLVKLDIIESSEPYAQMVRFRNLIVHQYEEIDPHLLFSTATKRLREFRRFRDEVDDSKL